MVTHVSVEAARATVAAAVRDQTSLDRLARLLGPRVRPAAETGIEADDRARIAEAADRPIDAVLNLLPRMATPSQVLAALLAVRPGGSVVLMGGAGGPGLEFSHSWLMHNEITVRGKWMYQRHPTHPPR